jgi:hypothetical protein
VYLQLLGCFVRDKTLPPELQGHNMSKSWRDTGVSSMIVDTKKYSGCVEHFLECMPIDGSSLPGSELSMLLCWDPIGACAGYWLP